LSNKNVVKLNKVRGKFIHSMGYSDQDAKEQKYDFLYPDEALYLNENVKFKKDLFNNLYFFGHL
jgi:hypothetical protein